MKFILQTRVGHTHTNGSLIVGYSHFTTVGCSLLDFDLYVVSCDFSGRPGFLRTYSSSSDDVTAAMKQENEKMNKRNDDTTASEESKGTRENLNSYIQSQTTHKLSLIFLLEWVLPILVSVILAFVMVITRRQLRGGASSLEWFSYTFDLYLEDSASFGRSRSTPSVSQPIPGEEAMPPALPVMQEAANQDLPDVLYPHDEIIEGTRLSGSSSGSCCNPPICRPRISIRPEFRQKTYLRSRSI